jgi:hypothetical protein
VERLVALAGIDWAELFGAAEIVDAGHDRRLTTALHHQPM